MKTNHEYMSELFRDNRTLEENALGMTLAKALEGADSEYSDYQVEALIAYYRVIKDWLESPMTKTLTPEEVAEVENRRTP